MRISTQFKIILAVFSVLLIVITVSIVATSQQVNKTRVQENLANNIVQDASNLSYLSNDYVIYQGTQQLTQWQVSYASFSDNVGNLTVTTPEQQALVNDLQNNQQRIKTVFDSIVASTGNSNSSDLHSELQVSWSRVSILSTTLISDATQLAQLLRFQVDQQNTLNLALIIGAIAVFTVFIGIIYFQAFRRTLKSLSNLRSGAAVIGSGNLDFKFDENKKDEIGELSQAFNQMGANLKNVTASKTDLEQEIVGRKLAETSLRESEQRWSTTLASIGDAVIATDISGKIVFMNGVAEELTGWTLNEASFKPVKEVFNIVNEQTRFEVEDPVSKVLVEGMIVGLANHTLLIRKNKTEVAIDDSGAPIKDKEGKTTGVVLIFRDITERKKAEESQKENEERLQQALDAGEFGLWGLNVITGKAWRTLRHDQIFGYNELLPEWTYQMFLSHVSPEDRAMVDKKFGGALKNGTEWNFECRIKRANGEEHWIWAQGKPKFNEKHTVVQLVGLIKDITERKKAEAEIARVASFPTLNPNPVVEIDASGHISFSNPSALALFSDIEKVGLSHPFLSDWQKVIKIFEDESLSFFRREVKVGEQWYYQTLFHVPSTNLIRIYGIDITERKNAELDLKHKTEQLENTQVKLEENAIQLEEYSSQMEELAEQRAAKLKDAERLAAIGATAGMVGHDIRNPLQAITGDIYLAKSELESLLDGEEKKAILESLIETEKNVDYINKIVQDLQDFARPLKPTAEETDLKLVIENLLKKNGLPENVKVTVKVDPDARKVVADSTFINRIMYNLVTNAVQAMPKGGKLTIYTYKETNDVLITVKDTGVGIPEAVKSKLFTPMFTTKSKGQGFGLAVIKRMTESLGGTVTFESQEGKGTTFIIRLPSPKK